MGIRGSRSRVLILLFAVALLVGAVPTVSAADPLPSCRIANTLTKHRTLADWRRSLLDSEFRLSSKYKPSSLRSTASAGLNGGYKVRSFVIADLRAMATAARKARARFSVQSAYRSYATQKSTFAYWVDVHGYQRAITESARAGHSEHQLGTTLDLRSYGGRAPWDVKDWGTSRAGTWLRKNSWKYGFVLSYPKGKSPITCYDYEPWHFRYVGRSVAAKVHASGLTLREYLWRRQAPTTAAPAPTPTPTPTPTPEPTPTPTPVPEG
jgi:D-alanyl-D-alanine carboxypeptidase